MSPFRALVLFALLALPSVAVAAPDESGMPTATVRRYEPYSRGTDYTRGWMKLSTASARFTALKGTMELEYAGEMPASPDFETGGARIFRVNNAAAYFQGNKGKNGFCDKPVQWLGIRPMGEGQVRVTFWTIADYRSYAPGGSAVCSGDSYALVTK